MIYVTRCCKHINELVDFRDFEESPQSKADAVVIVIVQLWCIELIQKSLYISTWLLTLKGIFAVSSIVA